MKVATFLTFALCAFSSAFLSAAPVPLFDGKTLDGWDGDTKVWRVEEGTIVAGSMEGNPQNEFLTTKKSYRNFKLRLEYKLVGTEGFVNGGVQFRSKRISDPPNEMSGYQADIGAGYSGCLYDESRRKKMLATANKEFVQRIEKPGEWNTYEIRCEGPRIMLKLNNQQTIDFTERQPGIEKDGLIALQIHGNCKAVVAYRNITIEELPEDQTPSQEEILERLGDPQTSKASTAPFKDAKFSLDKDEVVVFTGQTNLVYEQKAGELEGILSTTFADKAPRFRPMAWEGDTVYEQWRDLNFGSWSGQLEATGASVVVAQFGQTEAFDGKEKLPQFIAAYHQLLDEFAKRTQRIVLISPMPFEKPQASHAPDLTKRNEDVRAYAEAIREIAKQRGAVYVDLFTPIAERSANVPRFTDNGLHLNADGLRLVANIIAQQLGIQVKPAADVKALHAAIIEKNRLWFDCWRPANWSFVYGDRVTQLFGKSGGDEPSLRESFENHKPLIAAMDDQIYQIARGEKPAPLSLEKLSNSTAPHTEIKQLTPEEEKATFTLAEGYEINLFASELDDVVKPTQFSWDEKGRLYVGCSPTYPHVLAGAKPGDYILVLEDTNGDGKADKSWRFAEGLTMVQGVEPGDGGVYACDFDQIVHFKDTDGDGKADQRRVIFSGFGVGDTHQLVNSIMHGPDGSLWFTQGLHAFSRVETPWGLARLDKAGVWKLRPRTQRLDAFFNGGKAGYNCWGVAFDDYNQVFHKSGDRPDGYYTVPGMIRINEPDDFHPTGSLFASNPKTTALEIIGTKALPENIQGHAIIAGYFGSVIELHRFIDDGAGFRTEQLPKLLTSTTDSFRPVEVGIGPDGAIYVADWFNPIIGHYQASYADPRRDKAHGRIWRITAKGKAPIKQPNLAAMKAAELLDQLRSPERWTRYQAKRVLFDLPSADVIAAADVWTSKLDPAAPDYERLLLEVSGIFEAHETTRPELLEKLMVAKDFRVRAYGSRVVGDWADRLPDPLALLRRSIVDENPRVRMESIIASSYVAKPEAIEVATLALDKPSDRFIDYTLAQVTRALKPLWQKPLSEKKLTFGGNATHAAYVHKVADAAPVVQHPGKAIFDSLCLNCHQPDGKGLAGVYPPLVGSEWVRGDKDALIKMLMHGLMGPITVAGQEYGKAVPVPMPPSGLNDKQIADVLSYIRNNFGHKSASITTAEVEAVRAQTKDRTTMWTPDELLKK